MPDGFFIILSGKVEMTVDGSACELLPGDAIIVAPHEVHTMRNLTDSDLEYVVLGISSGQGGRTVVV
jgi:quercetin dioxygenase-like cupin family protein